MSITSEKTILVTGGTGSFGQAVVATLLQLKDAHRPRKVIVFSRDELKQSEMKERLPDDDRLRFFLGDVRDLGRLREAFHGVDLVIHAAALKQVPAAEYNPTEAVATNVKGTENVAKAAIETHVERVIMLSTDKAVSPVNLYGATKLTAERILIAANALAGASGTRFSVVRYGNVVGSRGSVVERFRALEGSDDAVPITSMEMTRFWVTLRQAVQFVLVSLDLMVGGEVFVPKLRSARMVDLAYAMLHERPIKVIGVRRGEKLHETLISTEEAGRTLDYGSGYVIIPDFDWRASDRQLSLGLASYQADQTSFTVAGPVPAGFSYHSNAGLHPHLTVAEIKALLKDVP